MVVSAARSCGGAWAYETRNAPWGAPTALAAAATRQRRTAGRRALSPDLVHQCDAIYRLRLPGPYGGTGRRAKCRRSQGNRGSCHVGPHLARVGARGSRLLMRASLVVEPGLQNDQIFAVDEVDEAVFFGDPPRPGAREHVPQWFWLADAGRGIAQGVIDEPVDSLQHGAVGRQPVGVVLPAVRGEDEPHRARLCSSRCPDRACCRLSIRRLALAGTRSRCAVSSKAS